MGTSTDAPGDELDAGPFGAWLAQLLGAVRGEGETDVPCGTCVACCSSSQFVHIEPDEVDTLAHIPAALRFPAPRLPRGHVLLGYDERGRCPMLTDAGCSIYEHRPRTCRRYDCRVLPAAGVDVGDDPDKVAIHRQATRWRFTHPSADDRRAHEAVTAAAGWFRAHPGDLPDGMPVALTTQVAVLSAAVHDVFLAAALADRDVTAAEVRVAVRRRTGTDRP
jgi:hypothetical protein